MTDLSGGGNGTRHQAAPGQQPVPAETGSPDPLLAHVVYGLYAIGLISGGLPGIIGVIIAHLKREDVAGTWLESHYQWQIRTFWLALVFFVIGIVLIIIAVGWIVIAAVYVWVIYRIIKGWLRLTDRQPIERPADWI